MRNKRMAKKLPKSLLLQRHRSKQQFKKQMMQH